MSLKIVLAGFGPCGQAVYSMLSKEFQGQIELVVIDPMMNHANSSNKQEFVGSSWNEVKTTNLLRNSLQRISLTASPFDKRGEDLGNTHEGSPANIWGTSCLPFTTTDLQLLNLPAQTFFDEYAKVADFFGVGTYLSSPRHQDNFPISGEYIHEISEHPLAVSIRQRSQMFSPSRLALETRAKSSRQCQSLGRCFDLCDVKSPWTPALAYQEIRHNGNFLLDRVTRIDLDTKSLFLDSGSSLHYDVLLLSVGVRQTANLIASIGERSVQFETGPVDLVPVLFSRPVSESEYRNRWNFNHLIADFVSESSGLEFLVQVYLPSVEISARILSIFPRPIQEIFLRKFMLRLFRHVGVFMVFSRSTKNGKSTRRMRRKLFWESLRARALVLGFAGKRLPVGGSQHFGALSYSGESARGFKSQLFQDLLAKDIVLADTSILPYVPAGPLTSTAATFARIFTRKFLLGKLR